MRLKSKNPALEGALPDNYYSRLHMDPSGLSSLLDLINGLDFRSAATRTFLARCMSTASVSSR